MGCGKAISYEYFMDESIEYDIYDDTSAKPPEYYYERTRCRTLGRRPGHDTEVTDGNEFAHESGHESAQVMFIVLTFVFGFFDLIIMTSVFHKPVRRRASAWFVFHLTAVNLVMACVLHPMLALKSADTPGTAWCIALRFLQRLKVALVNTSVLFINAETIFGILAKYRFWNFRWDLRGMLMLGLSWGFTVFLLAYVFATSLTICPLFSDHVQLTLDLFENWVPGALLVLATVVAVCVFWGTRTTAQTVSGHAQQARTRERREWLTLLLSMNTVYLVFHVLPSVLLQKYVGLLPARHVETVYIRAVRDTIPLALSLMFLIVTECRDALRHVQQKVCQCLLNKRTNQETINDTKQHLHLRKLSIVEI